MHAIRGLFLVAALSVLAACGQVATYPAGSTCNAATFAVEDGFSGARRGQCTVLARDHVELRIRPEDAGRINNSPWYAFRLVPAQPGAATVTLRYEGGNHRYPPKISSDGLSWSRLDEAAVRTNEDRTRATFDIALGNEPLYVAAQELITPRIYAAWMQKTAAATATPLRQLGSSRKGLPINAFDSNAGAKDVLMLVGRQHPPEVSGAFAMLAFVETVLGDADLARRFRERFRVIAIPLLNPDGVVGGNWRHNLGGTDLNRDWGPFTQPETRAVAELLDELDRSGSNVRVVLDFHSTNRNVFYAHHDETRPAGFTKRWLEGAAARMEGYEFSVSRSPIRDYTVAKNYLFRRYGIPAITYEVADETDRAAARAAAVIFAEDLMRQMLDETF